MGQGLDVVTSELAGIAAGGLPPTLPASAVLTMTERVQFEATLQAYNQIIAADVAGAGGTLVDMHGFFASLADGVSIHGTTLNLGFLGGFFSVDGLNPTNTGSALLANHCIASTNLSLGLFFPRSMSRRSP